MKKNSKAIAKDMRKSAVSVKGNGSALANNLISPIGGTSTLTSPISVAGIKSGITIQDVNDAKAAAQIEKRNRYDYLLSTPLDALTNAGYFVTTDNGSIFKGTPEYAQVYLAIQDTQAIENERGTPGTLLIHMKQPALAKDTAGYEGGSSSTFTDEPPVKTPIPEIQVLPPVIKDDTGVVYFDPAVATDPNAGLPAGNTTPTGTTQASMTGGKMWWLWYLLAAIAIILFLKYGRK